MYRSGGHLRPLQEADFLPAVVGVVRCTCIDEFPSQQLPSLLLPLLVHLQCRLLALVEGWAPHCRLPSGGYWGCALQPHSSQLGHWGL